MNDLTSFTIKPATPKSEINNAIWLWEVSNLLFSTPVIDLSPHLLYLAHKLIRNQEITLEETAWLHIAEITYFRQKYIDSPCAEHSKEKVAGLLLELIDLLDTIF